MILLFGVSRCFITPTFIPFFRPLGSHIKIPGVLRVCFMSSPLSLLCFCHMLVLSLGYLFYSIASLLCVTFSWMSFNKSTF